MQHKYVDLLHLLKAELKFLEAGGYAKVAASAGRPALIFEDSAICPNFENPLEPFPCTTCALMRLVPPGHRLEETPCRHIALNSQGDTVDSLYRNASLCELEWEFDKWLRSTIREIEQARASSMPLQPGCDTTLKMYHA